MQTVALGICFNKSARYFLRDRIEPMYILMVGSFIPVLKRFYIGFIIVVVADLLASVQPVVLQPYQDLD